MAKTTTEVYVERWMTDYPTQRWFLVLEQYGNALPITEPDAKNLIGQGIENRGEIWEPARYMKGEVER